MRLVILSGGSGNDSLIKGLTKLNKNIDIKVIVNAYDNGKSTGICRKITNTLGVSDIRKNHSRLYEALNSNPDKRLLEFYNNRYDINNKNDIINLLDNWGLNNFKKYAINFFKNKESKNYEFKDFSIANIIYSQMYKEKGYEYTNNVFCNLLGINDFVY